MAALAVITLETVSRKRYLKVLVIIFGTVLLMILIHQLFIRGIFGKAQRYFDEKSKVIKEDTAQQLNELEGWVG